MINQHLLETLEHNASFISNPVRHSIAVEMLWSVRRQRAYQLALVEAQDLIKEKPEMSTKDLLFWINERTELAHINQENINVN